MRDLGVIWDIHIVYIIISENGMQQNGFKELRLGNILSNVVIILSVRLIINYYCFSIVLLY
jgi:hypothetical protein